MIQQPFPSRQPALAGSADHPQAMRMAAAGGNRRASARRGGAIYGTGGAGGAGPLLRTAGLILLVIVGLILIAKNCTGDETTTQNLQSQVEATLKLNDIEGVEVAVDGSTAVLSGTVTDEAKKSSAEGFAIAVEGVDQVVNDIFVDDGADSGTVIDSGNLEQTLANLVAAAPIKFASGSTEISDASRATLDQVAQAINASPGVPIIITGYTDNTGSDDGNRRISEERAQAVRTYLIGVGVDGTRLTALGKGPENPVADNSTEEGREQNRRIEFTLS